MAISGEEGVVVDGEEDMQHVGMRGRLGEVCYRSGLLWSLQKLRALLRDDLRILAYHRVLDIADTNAFTFDLGSISADAEGFRAQLKFLKRRFQPIRLSDMLTALASGSRLPKNAVAVTFDDGYEDNYRVAYPILRELDVPATFFVSTGHIDSGQPFAYDWLVHMILLTTAPRLILPEIEMDVPIPPARSARRKLAGDLLRLIKPFDSASQMAVIARVEREWDMPRNARNADCLPMTWHQLREMHASGFEIGSHGVSHQMLARLPDVELHVELQQSKATLEHELGAPAACIAYPVGGYTAFDRRVIDATKAAGYGAACSYLYGTNLRSSWNQFALNRLPVEREMGIGWFSAMLTLPEFLGYSIKKRPANISDAECSS